MPPRFMPVETAELLDTTQRTEARIDGSGYLQGHVYESNLISSSTFRFTFALQNCSKSGTGRTVDGIVVNTSGRELQLQGTWQKGRYHNKYRGPRNKTKKSYHNSPVTVVVHLQGGADILVH